MRRFGNTERFLGLIEQIRAITPDAGIRTNVIVGFPGETDGDVAELERFLTAARLDAVGVFGYSDEDNTEAATLPDKVDQDVIDERVELVTALVDELVAQRAEDRIGDIVQVLVERLDADGTAEGRAAHQGPEVDGTTTLRPAGALPYGSAPQAPLRTVPAGSAPQAPLRTVQVGEIVAARVIEAEGCDLVAEPISVSRAMAATSTGSMPAESMEVPETAP